MSFTVSTGYRKPIYTFSTPEEASRFNDELFAKTKVRGAITSSTSTPPTYVYDNKGKLKKI